MKQEKREREGGEEKKTNPDLGLLFDFDDRMMSILFEVNGKVELDSCTTPSRKTAFSALFLLFFLFSLTNENEGSLN